MKAFIIASLLVLSFPAMSSSFCYDQAIFAVDRFKTDVAACNSGVDLTKFDKLNTKLRKTIFFYERIVNKAHRSLMKTLNNSNRDHMSAAESECLDETIQKHEKIVDGRIRYATQICKW